MYKIFIYTIIISMMLSSCSFNKMFLQPFKIPANHPRLKSTNKKTGDSSFVFFNGTNRQPTFTTSKKDTIQLDYTIESVFFKSDNGNQLNGWLLIPKNKKPSITILHLHGNEGCLFAQYQAMEPLVKKGIQVFMFDYSGFGFSEGKGSRSNVLADANAALTYLVNRKEVFNTQIVIYGQSFGGHLAVVLGTKRQSQINAMVIEGAFSSHKDIAAKHASIFGRLFVKEMYAAKTSIKNFYKPLLIIHSIEDEVIPFAMGQKLFKNANEPKQFFEIKKPHIMGPIFYTNEIYQKMLNMLSDKVDMEQ
jgi:uncharacterized protein